MKKIFSSPFIKATDSFSSEYTGKTPAHLFRRKFIINEEVCSAKLFVCGLGIGYYFINGKRVSKDLFTAPVSTYDKLVWFNTYNVKRIITKGENIFAAILGNGFFNENFPSHWNNNKASYRDNPKLAVKLMVNDKIVFESDEGFVCTEQSFVVHNQYRSGEIFDARLYDPKWKECDFNDKGWHSAFYDKTGFSPERRECKCEPIRECEVLSYVSCKKVFDGYLLDFGRNISGYVKCFFNEKPGTEITIQHAEEVYQDGRLKLNGLNVLYPSVDCMTDKYICGSKNLLWSPLFTYHGFRYVLISGIKKTPTKKDVKAIFVHQKIKRISGFNCSDELLNKIFDAGIASTQSNMFYCLTDCPTREKFGWTNDAQASAEQVFIDFNSTKFFWKWLQDFVASMDMEGDIPAIVPTHGYGYHHGPVADGAMFEIPLCCYKYTGNAFLLKKMLPYMERYYNYFSNPNLNTTCWLLDWDGYTNHNLNVEFVKAFYTLKFCDIILLAKSLNGDISKESYLNDRLQAEQKLNNYLNDNGESVIDSQTAISMLICSNIGNKDVLLIQLLRRIGNDDWHLNCGMLGIQYIYDALSQNGKTEEAYKLVTAKGIPGYSEWFKNGATTLWETWKDSNFTDSRNHHMFSNVLVWFFKYLLGIKVSLSNNGKLEYYIEPNFIKELSHCEGYITLPSGKIEVSWKRKENDIVLTIVIPYGFSCLYKDNKLLYGKNIINIKG